MYLLQEDCHTEWVSCVRFSPNTQNPLIVSAGWDHLVKVNFLLTRPSVLDFGYAPQDKLCLFSSTTDWQSRNWLPSVLQVWNLTNCKLRTNHFGHQGYLNCVTVSPDGSLCASGGKVCVCCFSVALPNILCLALPPVFSWFLFVPWRRRTNSVCYGLPAFVYWVLLIFFVIPDTSGRLHCFVT